MGQYIHNRYIYMSVTNIYIDIIIYRVYGCVCVSGMYIGVLMSKDYLFIKGKNKLYNF